MTITIPDSTLAKANISPSELLIEVAVYLYDKERLTMGQAKRLAGLNHIAFQKELAKQNVYIKLDIEDLELDLKNLELLK